MSQTFVIPGRLPGCNDFIAACKSHYSKAGRVKSETQDLIGWCIKQAHIKPVHGKVIIHFTWIEPNMKRDFDNIAFAKKFIFDALQEMLIIPSDGWKYVSGFSDAFDLDRNNPRIIVEIDEV